MNKIEEESEIIVSENGAKQDVKDLVNQGMRIMKIENETQQLIAVQKPRNEVEILDKSAQELRLCPEFAKSAFYSIPYKDYQNKDASGQPRTVWVEGLSIKAAMALARRWGNCSSAVRIIDENDERITVEGVFMDYETNMRTLRTVSVSKLAFRKATKTFSPLSPDRLNMAIQSGMSKAVRNAILASLPDYLKEAYFTEAKRLVIGKKDSTPLAKKDLNQKIKELIQQFSDEGITKDQITNYLGKSTMGEGELVKLQGLLTAIKEGNISKDVFEVEQTKTQENKNPINIDSLEFPEGENI